MSDLDRLWARLGDLEALLDTYRTEVRDGRRPADPQGERVLVEACQATQDACFAALRDTRR